VERMGERGIPAVTPPGGLAGHVDAMKFCSHIPQLQYPAGALTTALYIVSGARGMERGSISMERDENGNEVPSDVELCRLAVPRRVFSMAHIEYVVDRLAWLYQHRRLIGGLRFKDEPPVLRFFIGRLEPIDDWGSKLAAAYQAEFGEV
ncbi:MAG: tryptophanase, partial [Kiritimatiellia bacterium]